VYEKGSSSLLGEQLKDLSNRSETSELGWFTFSNELMKDPATAFFSSCLSWFSLCSLGVLLQAAGPSLDRILGLTKARLLWVA
jgi:hypothetical protein